MAEAQNDLPEEDFGSAQATSPISPSSPPPSKLTKPPKPQKRASSFMNLPALSSMKSSSSLAPPPSPTAAISHRASIGSTTDMSHESVDKKTTANEVRPQSFYVSRANSEFGERRNRTFSDLTMLNTSTPATTTTVKTHTSESDRPIREDLLTHMRALCMASRDLAANLEFDPSPNEAASTFLQNEAALVKAYTGWSSIVGEAILSGVPTRVPSRLAGKDAAKQRRRKSSKSPHGSTAAASSSSMTKVMGPPSGDLLLADIVIKPTARAGQYVLLFQAILDCLDKAGEDTTLVQQALESARRLTWECDKLQVTDLSRYQHHRQCQAQHARSHHHHHHHHPLQHRHSTLGQPTHGLTMTTVASVLEV